MLKFEYSSRLEPDRHEGEPKLKLWGYGGLAREPH